MHDATLRVGCLSHQCKRLWRALAEASQGSSAGDNGLPLPACICGFAGVLLVAHPEFVQCAHELTDCLAAWQPQDMGIFWVWCACIEWAVEEVGRILLGPQWLWAVQL